jgi:mRNA interferase YafQ
MAEDRIIPKLLDGKELPLEARNHNLIGNYSGFKEFHVGDDLLVIYCIEDDILRLTRIGTHSQLFK